MLADEEDTVRGWSPHTLPPLCSPDQAREVFVPLLLLPPPHTAAEEKVIPYNQDRGRKYTISVR